MHVRLSKNGKSKEYIVSRLVAAGFHGLDLNNPKMLACHKDDNPTNNHEDNIFVGTASDNMQDMFRKGRSNNSFMYRHPRNALGKFGADHPKSRPVLQLHPETNAIVNLFPSATEAANYTKIPRTGITKCCNETAKLAGKFKWRFLKPDEIFNTLTISEYATTDTANNGGETV